MSLDRNLDNNLERGEWPAYINLQNKLLLSLEKINDFVKEIEKYSNIDPKDIHSLSNWAFSFRISSNSKLHGAGANSENTLNNVRMNSRRIILILNGGGDNGEGLINITKNEINGIKKLLEKDPVLAPDSQKTLKELVVSFSSRKLALYENLRELLGREETLGLELERYEEQTLEEYIEGLLRYCRDFIAIIERNDSDEAILFKFLEIAEYIENARNISSEIEDNSLLSSVGDSTLRLNVQMLIQNYFRYYTQPIIQRISRVREIMGKYNNTFFNLPDDEKEDVLLLYNEFIDHLFTPRRNTTASNRLADLISARRFNVTLESNRKLYTKLSQELLNKVIKAGFNISDMSSLVVFNETETPQIYSIYRRIDTRRNNRPTSVSFQDLNTRLNSSNVQDTAISDFFNILNPYIKNIIDHDNHFQNFLRLQRENQIADSNRQRKQQSLIEAYNNEIGNGLRQTIFRIYDFFTQVRSIFLDMPVLYNNNQRIGELLTNFPTLLLAIRNVFTENPLTSSDYYNSQVGTLQSYSDEIRTLFEDNLGYLRGRINGYISNESLAQTHIARLERERQEYKTRENQRIQRITRRKENLQAELDGLYRLPYGNSENRIPALQTQISNLEQEINDTTPFDSINIDNFPQLDNNGSVSVTSKNLNSLNDLENAISELQHFKSSIQNSVQNFQQIIDFLNNNRVFLTQITNIIFYYNQEGLRNIVDTYMRNSDWAEDATFRQVWNILNKDFRELAPINGTNSNNTSNNQYNSNYIQN